MVLQQGRASFSPTAADVIAAVESLYKDQLKPFGRIVLRRVSEHAAAQAAVVSGDGACATDSVPRIDTKRLRRTCETCRQLLVESEEGGEYSVYLVGRPRLFVDAGNSFDPYPAEFWADVAVYLQGLSDDEALLPGGRYACAQLLVARRLPFLANRCLGEVCHIIALAISHKKLLGYADGYMVPFSRSETGLKEHFAAWQQPVCNPKKASSLPVATWEEARACLREILKNAAKDGPGNVPLPNVKRLFLSRFNLELSETALGHSRVYDLLQDQRFQDVCRVHRQGNTYYVVPAMLLQTSCASGRVPAASKFSCLSTSPMQTHTMAVPMPTTVAAPMAPPIMPPMAPPIVAPVFQSTMPSLPLSLPEVSIGPGLTKDCLQHDDSDASTADGSFEDSSSSDEFPHFAYNPSSDFEDSPFLLDGSFSDMLACAEDDGDSVCTDITSLEDVDIRNTFIHIAAPKLAQHGSRRRTQSLPKNIRMFAEATSSSPCPTTSRRSWADEDPSDFGLEESSWNSDLDEVSIPESVSDETAWKLQHEAASSKWESRNWNHRGWREQGGKGSWNSWKNRDSRRWCWKTSSKWSW